MSVWLGFQCFHPAQSQTPDNFSPGANGIVSALAVQPDGKIVAGGLFTQIGGLARARLARLHPDGVVDTTFAPAANDTIYSLAIQPGGKVLVGGDFTSLAGGSKLGIGRLNTNGTLDTGFTMTVTPPPGYSYATRVQSIIMQPDGKLVVGGRTTITPSVGPAFTTGFNRRLNTNGTTDNTFSTTGGVGGPVSTMAQQPDGKLLLGGLFTTLRNVARNRMGRLNADGSLDPTFDPNVNGGVFAVAIQADEKILIGGSFTTVAGQPRTNLARLHPDGSLDDTYAPAVTGGVTPVVYSLAVQTDGKVLVGGLFTTVAGQARMNLARLNPEGTLDQTFTTTANNFVYGLALQADGKMLVGGQFFQLGGQPRSYIGRLNNTAPATQSLSDDSSTITWLRGGTSPEVWRTRFEMATNGFDWTNLGDGMRIGGGWELAGAALLPNRTIRVRGYIAGGGFNGSSWFDEALVGAPLFVAQPTNRTNNAGTAATFSAAATLPPQNGTYRWLKGGVPLDNLGNISGADTATLSLSNVLGADAGGYRLVASNVWGSVTSVVATLTVVDPVITGQPTNQYAEWGQSATLSVTAAGTAIHYQWRKDGLFLPQANEATLTLTNLQVEDAGRYSVVLSNTYRSVTSSIVTLVVNQATLDADFSADTVSTVTQVGIQRDGKIVVGGLFSTLAGQPRSRLGRLNPDGTLDMDFNPGAGGNVDTLAIQADGGILVGGEFTTLGGQPCNYLGRLNSQGVLDPNYHPAANNWVYGLAIQPDGKTLAGGLFGIVRFDAGGALDLEFDPDVAGGVYSLALQADGKILVGGNFDTVSGQPRTNIARLFGNGTVDAGFNPGAEWIVYSMAVQADGKILVGGGFTDLGGVPRERLGRLHPNGTLDLSFDSGANGTVNALAVQTDGKIVVGGSFSTLGGQPRNRIGRLRPDGTLDAGFNPDVSTGGGLSALAIQPDGKIIVVGSFSVIAGQPRRGIARLNNTGVAEQILQRDGAGISWWRSGAGPEVWQATFEASTNGSDWVTLGAGARISGGWRWNGVSPPNASIRVRGYVSGGAENGSSWYAESWLPIVPQIVTDDGFFGFDANQLFGFTVRAPANTSVVVDASTNLIHWSGIQTNSANASKEFFFQDSGSGIRPERFYRARFQ